MIFYYVLDVEIVLLLCWIS